MLNYCLRLQTENALTITAACALDLDIMFTATIDIDMRLENHLLAADTD